MVRPSLIVSIPALVLALSASAAPAALKPGEYRIAGLGRDAEGKTIAQDQLSFESSGVAVSLRYLTDPARRSALASVLGEEADLFPEHPEAVRGYLVFVLEIRNGAKGDLIFEPGQSRLLTDRHDAEFPFDYTLLYQTLEAFKLHPDGRDWRLEQVERAVYSRAVTITPGGAVRKLLVFREPLDERFRKFQVRIGALHLPESDLDATFKFKKFKIKK